MRYEVAVVCRGLLVPIVKYMKCVSRLRVVVFYVAHMLLIAEVEAAAYTHFT